MKARQSVTHVPVERLTAHPANIRQDLGDLTEMALSVAEHGILQPLTATEDLEHDGQLLLLAGHRRLGAAILAKLDVLPVIIRHGLSDPAEQLVVMLVENTQRKDLNPMDRAEAYGALRNRGLTTVEIGRRTGTHFSTVSYYLNLLMLDPYERQQVREGTYNSTAAVADVREKRQEARLEAGMAPRGRRPGTGKFLPSWFNPEHRLAETVRKTCTHGDRMKIGGAGCGPCWERAIIADAGQTLAHAENLYNQSLSDERPYDEAVVVRRLNGDHTVRMCKADRREAIRRCHARGLSDGEAGDLIGMHRDAAYRLRSELGLPANRDGGNNPVHGREAS